MLRSIPFSPACGRHIVRLPLENIENKLFSLLRYLPELS
jgi:hypothetical protein